MSTEDEDVRELVDQLEEVASRTDRLRRAWFDAGPRPDIHRAAQNALQREWPELWWGIIEALSVPIAGAAPLVEPPSPHDLLREVEACINEHPGTTTGHVRALLHRWDASISLDPPPLDRAPSPKSGMTWAEEEAFRESVIGEEPNQ